MRSSVPRLTSSPVRLGLTITAVVFVAEATVMSLLIILPPLPPFLTALLDACLLTVLVSPALYFYLLRPMTQQIAEREQAEAGRHATEQRLANVFDTAADAIILFDQDLRISLFNQGAQQIFGYRAQEVLGQPLDLLLPARFVQAHRGHVHNFTLAPEMARHMDNRREIYGRRKDGTEFPAESSISKLVQEGQITYTALLHDITRRKRAEEALRKAHGELEERVRERTAELTQANEALQQERQHVQRMAVEAQQRADELDAVFTAMADAVFVFDTDGVALRANPAALAMYGPAQIGQLKRAQLFQSASIHYPGGRPVAWDDLPVSRALRGETVRDHQLILTNMDGRNLTVLASASPLFAGDQVSGAVAVWHDLTEHERLAALEERQHLARELHDSLSQTLYSIALGAHTALTFLDNNQGKTVEALNYVLSLADAGLTEMRALIFNLRPESLEAEGLANALTKQAAALQTRYDITVRMEICEEPDVPLETKEAIYRIAQEALNNAVKHAQANWLGLWLCRERGHLVLEVNDDGVGFDSTKAHPGHFGLNSMRERASRLRGQLEIQTAPGCGTRVRAEFPLSLKTSPDAVEPMAT